MVLVMIKNVSVASTPLQTNTAHTAASEGYVRFLMLAQVLRLAAPPVGYWRKLVIDGALLE